ncbi:MFS general substrate transporter [Amylostereum chailletii]|nr:MFS general substrate transporter [Amylostereum chailletii]
MSNHGSDARAPHSSHNPRSEFEPGLELALRLPRPPSSSTFAAESSLGPHNEVFASQRNETSLAPVDGGFGAWSFLAGAFLVETIVWGFPNAFGVFLQAYLQDPNISSQPHASSVLPLAGTLSSGIIYCSGPLVNMFCGRYPIHRRTAMWIGVVLCWSSLFGASFATTVSQLVALQGVLYAIGGSLLYTPTISFLSEWFVRRGGLANGVVFAGTGLGGLILPLILPPLIRAHGTSLTLRYLSIAIVAALLPVLPFVRPRLPEKRIHGPGRRNIGYSWLRSWVWWTLLVANTIQGFAHFLPIIWLPTYASLINTSQSTSAISVALLNGASVCSRLILGTISDRFSPRLLATSTVMGTSFITFVLWGIAGHVTAGVLVYGTMYGLFAGGWSSLWTGFVRLIAKDDPELTTSLFSFLLLSRGIGNVLSTPISTALSMEKAPPSAHEETGFAVAGGRFEKMIVYVGTCFAGVAVIALGAWVREIVTKKKAAMSPRMGS